MRPLLQEPAAREKKPSFAEVPEALVGRLENLCGAKIEKGETAFGGFSAAAGFALTLEGGRRVFVKGAHPGDTSHGAASLRQEIHAYGTVAALRDIAPRYFGCVSDGNEDGWMLGAWEYVAHDAARASPERVMDALRAWTRGDGAQGALPLARAHVYIGGFFRDEKKWRRIRDEAAVREKFLSLFAEPAGAWLEKNIAALCALQAGSGTLRSPEGVLHGDLRLDNFLFAKDRTYIVDWPNACFGPVVLDLAFLYASLEAGGLARAEEAFAAWNGGCGREDFIVMLGTLAGYFADQAYRAVPPMMPRLRWMQQSMLLAQLKSLARSGIIESPPRMRGENQP